MDAVLRKRRVVAGAMLIVIAILLLIFQSDNYQNTPIAPSNSDNTDQKTPALNGLTMLEIKGRASKTGYSREQFGNGWSLAEGCDTRNLVLMRDLREVVLGQDCKVESGVLDDPYSGKTIDFRRGASTSDDVQIDHVVALSDAWQKGAQQLTLAKRIELANDPLELIAVDGSLNQQKSGSDAASWLPPNKDFRCQYVARQIAVKMKYELWVTSAEHGVMQDILRKCPGQNLP